jgi:holliday junction DNA helicase RuvA
MITRISGTLESLEGSTAAIRPEHSGLVYEVLLPAFAADAIAGRLGQMVTLHTLEYFESPNQGATFLPRLVGFPSAADRRFFELFTTVKGIGNRKALRAMAADPSQIAGWIAAHDTRALTDLPEIGKRLAETIVAELAGKVGPHIAPGAAGMEAKPARAGSLPQSAAEAVAALVALGETRADADERVRRALARENGLTSSEAIVAAALRGEAP